MDTEYPANTRPATRDTGARPPGRRRSARRWSALLDHALPVAGVALALGLWWLASALLVPRSGFLARFAPEPAFAALARLLASGELWPHLFASLRRVLLGLAISAALGFPLGLLVGGSRRFARLSGPVFQFLRMVSPLSWTPLAIILLGVGDAPVYFLLAIGGVWPVVLNTAAAVAALDRRWLTVGRSLGATRWEIARTIGWPAIRPQVLTGLRLAVGLTWIILVPAEMLGVDSGLGYFLLDTRDRLAYADLVATILVIGLCGFLIDSAARWLLRDGRRAAPGRPARAGGAADAVSAPGRADAARRDGRVPQPERGG